MNLAYLCYKYDDGFENHNIVLIINVDISMVSNNFNIHVISDCVR